MQSGEKFWREHQSHSLREDNSEPSRRGERSSPELQVARPLLAAWLQHLDLQDDEGQALDWSRYAQPAPCRGRLRTGFVSRAGVTGSITNSLGMPTPEPGFWRAEARRVAETVRDRFLVMSVTATVGRETSEEDMLSQFSSLALEGKNLGADAVELNFSCPNILPGEGERPSRTQGSAAASSTPSERELEETILSSSRRVICGTTGNSSRRPGTTGWPTSR